MENATKALLIAAAVLIAIVLVALGVNLLSSTGDTIEDTEEVTEQIGSSTNSAVTSLGTALDKIGGKRMITFYLNGDPYTCPEGYTVEMAVEKGFLDWQKDSNNHVYIERLDELHRICYENDIFLNWKDPLIEGEMYNNGIL